MACVSAVTILRDSFPGVVTSGKLHNVVVTDPAFFALPESL